MEHEQEESEITFAALYPELTLEQQVEVEYYLTRYVEVIHGIFLRLQQQDLTDLDADSSMRMN